MDTTSALLPHHSHNPEGADTILLIHGGFSSSEEWAAIWPLLAEEGYHVLVPDLPAHGAALERGIDRLELDDAARRLAELIEARARDRVAHVVAMSIGAHVVAALAARWPDRVRSLVVSGFNMFAPTLWSPLLPSAVYLTQLFSGQGNLSRNRDIFNILFSSRELRPIQTRTLVVAAARKGLSADNVDHACRLFRTVVNAGSRVVQNQQMRHPWNVDEPVVFAATVLAWITGNQALPSGFEDIPIEKS